MIAPSVKSTFTQRTYLQNKSDFYFLILAIFSQGLEILPTVEPRIYLRNIYNHGKAHIVYQ